ncbi:MAG TPA: class I SAM-dependent DNA methyltransferase, partial [Blastocatellia bacterium]|nr:class I SAM-dependent DNA methyltransferase [Blastocatellia bacterium]
MPANDPAIRDHQAWLGYLQPDGLVVSPAALVDAQVLLDRNTLPLQERFLPFVEEVERDDDTILAVTDFARFLREFLEWPDDLLFGLDGHQPLPESLSIPLPEFNETLAPSFAFKDTKPKDPDNPWLMLVQLLPLGVDLDQNSAGDDAWKASPSRRFERLLRETKVAIGLLVNGTQIRLMYAPKGENS